jgi:hypothetical protein
MINVEVILQLSGHRLADKVSARGIQTFHLIFLLRYGRCRQ